VVVVFEINLDLKKKAIQYYEKGFSFILKILSKMRVLKRKIKGKKEFFLIGKNYL